jgi:hypothetical protein
MIMNEQETKEKIARLEHYARDLEVKLGSPSPSRRGGTYNFFALDLLKTRQKIAELKGLSPTPAKKS